MFYGPVQCKPYLTAPSETDLVSQAMLFDPSTYYDYRLSPCSFAMLYSHHGHWETI